MTKGKSLKKYRALRFVLIAGFIYEILAVSRQIKRPYTQNPPTITHIFRKAGTKPYGKFALWLWTGYVAWHFLEPLEEETDND